MKRETLKKEAFMKVKGIVTEEVTQDEDRSRYTIRSDGKEYTVISTGRQAIKDNLFVRKGQCMEFECSEASENPTDGKLWFRKSKIMIAGNEVMRDDGRDERKATGCIEYHQSAEK